VVVGAAAVGAAVVGVAVEWRWRNMVRRREEYPGLAGTAAVPDGLGARDTGRIGIHANAARMGMKVEAKRGVC